MLRQLRLGLCVSGSTSGWNSGTLGAWCLTARSINCDAEFKPIYLVGKSGARVSWKLALTCFQRQEIPPPRARPLVSETRNGSPAPVVWRSVPIYPTTSLTQKPGIGNREKRPRAEKALSTPSISPAPPPSTITSHTSLPKALQRSIDTLFQLLLFYFPYALL